MTYSEKDVVESIDSLVPQGLSGGTTAEVLKMLDQFHVGGSQAVDRLLNTLSLTSADSVLDVGSGFGGPARQVAATSGCRVTGVDITKAYVDAASRLTERCGLSDRVQFVLSDIADCEFEQPFDAGFTMHVQMNVESKREWFREIARRLAPHAKFAVWEVCRTSSAVLSWPQPWSMDGQDSYIATSDELLGDIVAGGFQLVEWVDESAWAVSWFDTIFDPGAPMQPSLPMLLDDGFTRTLNFAAALADGTLGVRRGAFTRSLE